MARFAMCPDCGHRMRKSRDMFGRWDGEYICDYCDRDDDGEHDACPECGSTMYWIEDHWECSNCDYTSDQYLFGVKHDAE